MKFIRYTHELFAFAIIFTFALLINLDSRFTLSQEVYVLLVAVMPSALMHANLFVPREVSIVGSHPGIVVVIYVLGLIFALLGFRALESNPDGTRTVLVVSSVLTSISCVAMAWRCADSIRHERLWFTRVVLAALAISSLCFSIGLAAFVVGEIWAPLTLFFPASMATWSVMGSRGATISLSASSESERDVVTLSQIIRGMAHATRKPLASVMNQLATIEQENPVVWHENRLGQIKEQVGLVQEFIESVLKLARGQSVSQTRRFGVQSVLAKVAHDVLQRYPDATLDREQASDAYIRGDELSIRWALVNLIENAIEARPEAPWARISVTTDSIFVHIAIEDKSGGIQQDIQEDLFTPFVTSKDQGIGLGMATAREVARMHGGWIDVQSTDRGTVFIFSIQCESSMTHRWSLNLF